MTPATLLLTVILTMLSACDASKPSNPLHRAFFEATKTERDTSMALVTAALPFLQGKTRDQATQTLSDMGFSCLGGTCTLSELNKETGFEKLFGIRMPDPAEPPGTRRVFASQMTISLRSEKITSVRDLDGTYVFKTGHVPWFSAAKAGNPL
jgi:hypothetical protein